MITAFYLLWSGSVLVLPGTCGNLPTVRRPNRSRRGLRTHTKNESQTNTQKLGWFESYEVQAEMSTRQARIATNRSLHAVGLLRKSG